MTYLSSLYIPLIADPIPVHYAFPHQHIISYYILLREEPIIINYTFTPHHKTLYHYNYCHPPSAYTTTVHQKPYIIFYYPVTNCHHALFQSIRSFPNSRPYSSSVYIPPSADQIRLNIN